MDFSVFFLGDYNQLSYFLFHKGIFKEDHEVKLVRGGKMNLLANLLTMLSLVFGFLSIILSLEGQFTFASWAILLSVILDGLDGQIARRNPVPSDFGEELDSLVDVISFGIAPCILGYAFIYLDKQFYILATVCLFIYLVCAVFRLAKYNITPKETMKNFFYGLPITVSGGVLASFILIYRRYSLRLPPPRTFMLIVLILAALMVSRIKYINLQELKQVLAKSKLIPITSLLAAFAAVLLAYLKTGILLPEISIFVFFLIYLFSPLYIRGGMN